MPEPPPSPQQEPNSHLSSPREKIIEYKGQIMGMIIVLKPPANPREVKTQVIKEYERQLLEIVAEIEMMKAHVNMKEFFSNADAFLAKLQDYALVEILVALKKESEGEDHEYFRCLLRCPKYLEEALELFLI